MVEGKFFIYLRNTSDWEIKKKFWYFYNRFPVNFENENDDGGLVLSWETYSNELKTNIPELFSGQYKVITEFRWRINANPGLFATS